jgi:hypothetical protein
MSKTLSHLTIDELHIKRDEVKQKDEFKIFVEKTENAKKTQEILGTECNIKTEHSGDVSEVRDMQVGLTPSVKDWDCLPKIWV